MNQKTDMREALQLCIDAMLHDGVPTDPYHPRRIALNAAESALASRPDAQVDERGAFQSRVQPWMLACFGAEIAADTVERNHRFFEEAAELVQSCGMTASEAHQLVDYTWSRPVGEKTQEVGGVMVTLAALCLANGLDMHAAGETELARISAPETMAKIRAKQAAKPKHSPLPEARAAAPQAPQADERYDLLQAAVNCPHEIESNRVVLHYSDKQPGHNALAQLRERLARTAAPQAEAAQGVADGWKLVPIEPTVEMKIAGDNAAFWCGEKWKAMLSAAPAPVSEPEQPPAENAAVRNKIAAALHYPEHWDDTAYPTLDHAAWEAIATSKLACSECAEQPVEANVSIYVDCYECRECGHVGINDAHPTDAACGYPCGWSGPSPVEDKCPGCGKTNVMSSACPKCSGLYRMIAEAHIDSTSEQPSERVERPIEPEDIDAVAEAIQRETSVEWLIASRAAVAAIDTLIARGNHASEHGEQDCPHGVDDGACKQCYGEATRGEQGAALSDDAAVLSRLASVLETGHANNGIADDNAAIYATALRRILAASAPTLGDAIYQHDQGDGFWKDVPYAEWQLLGAKWRRIVYTAPAVAQPQADEPKGMTDEQCEELRLLARTYNKVGFPKYAREWLARAILSKGA